MSNVRNVLRIAGRAVNFIGLVLFYGSPLILAARLMSPEVLFEAALIVMAAGCLWQLGLLIRPSGNKGRGVFEAAVGFLCLPAGFLAMVAAGASGERIWLIIMIFLLTGAIALITQAARVKRAAEQWRNTGQGG